MIVADGDEPQAAEKFFDPTIFQKCWRGSGRAALIAARRQRNPCAMLHTERVVRKAAAFRGGANKTAPPCETKTGNKCLAAVPGEQLQRNITLQKILLLGKTIFSVRQKGVPPLLLPANTLQLPRCLV